MRTPARLWERHQTWLAPLSSLLILMTAFAIIEPRFSDPGNLRTVALQTATGGVLAIAQTLLIVCGAIDLSVGSVMALSAVMGGLTLKAGHPAFVAALACLATGLACGFVNGWITVKLRVPAFITTLGMMGAARGLALQFSGASTVYWSQPALSTLSDDTYLGLALPVWMLIAVALVIGVGLAKTVPGRYAYAIGSNAEAVRLAGARVSRYQIGYFMMAGLLVGLAGLMTMARTGVAEPTAGEGDELKAVAASVIGGASLMGGQGTVPGALCGAFLMEALRNGCNLRDVSVEWQKVVIGALIVAAVARDRFRRKE